MLLVLQVTKLDWKRKNIFCCIRHLLALIPDISVKRQQCCGWKACLLSKYHNSFLVLSPKTNRKWSSQQIFFKKEQMLYLNSSLKIIFTGCVMAKVIRFVWEVQLLCDRKFCNTILIRTIHFKHITVGEKNCHTVVWLFRYLMGSLNITFCWSR